MNVLVPAAVVCTTILNNHKLECFVAPLDSIILGMIRRTIHELYTVPILYLDHLY